MTAIRQEAVNLLEQMPEDKLYYIVQIMQGVNGLYKSEPKSKKMKAFESLEKLRKPVPDLDYEKELQLHREAKYGFTGVD